MLPCTSCIHFLLRHQSYIQAQVDVRHLNCQHPLVIITYLDGSIMHCAVNAASVLSIGSQAASPPSKKQRKGTVTPPDANARAGLLGEALHLLKRSQAVGESGIEALNGEGGVQELENIIGADATIKAWRFMQVSVLLSMGHAKFQMA